MKARWETKKYKERKVAVLFWRMYNIKWRGKDGFIGIVGNYFFFSTQTSWLYFPPKLLVAESAFTIAFVSWPATKVEIVRCVLLKWGTSTLIIWCTFTHFKPMAPCPCRIQTVQMRGSRDTRVERPVTEHFSAQGRPNLRGGLCCFWCWIKTWTSPIGASSAQKSSKIY